MNMRKCATYFTLTIIILINVNYCNGGIFSWLFKTNEPTDEKIILTKSYRKDINKGGTQVDDGALSVQIPFELKSSDEKFLNQVSEYTSTRFSELDLCHHKVILSLQKSCGDLTEEELAKVAVNLLNCQSAVENRAIYPCNEAMALGECTQNMDSDTWNAYHIISNRVRAVCYHYRQQQFTAKTEMTVNKLMISTEEQIDAMKLLEESQNSLKRATSDTLNSLSSGHELLQKQQRELSSSQSNIRSYVALNIRDLTREKRLIASGQKELADITLTIKKKLEEAQQQLKDQGVGQRDTHRKIIEDLSEIQDSASRVWNQIDESTRMILMKHEQTVEHYSRLMEDLQKMNATVHHLMDVLVMMKSKVEEKFSWITSLVGDTDATVQKIYCFVLHACYCLLGMVGASFLQVPYATRMALIIIVPLNALSEMKNDSSLHFSTLTLVLGVCMFFNLSTLGAVKVYHWRKHKRQTAITYSFEMKDQETTQTFAPNSSSDVRRNSDQKRNLLNGNKDEYSSEEETTPHKELSKASINLSVSQSSPLPSILEDKATGNEDRRTNFFPSTFNSTYQMPHLSLSDCVRRRVFSRDEKQRSPEPAQSTSLNEPLRTIRSPRLSPSPDVSKRSYSFRSPQQSLTPKKLCTATCKSGLLCKNVAYLGDEFCFRHMNGLSREGTPIR